MKTILLIGILTFNVNLLFSCSCITLENYNIKSEFKSRDLVFLGTVTQIDTITVTIYNFSTDEIWYTFNVQEFYKGKKKLKVLKIKSGFVGGDDCKFIFDKGKSYVVYANNEKPKGKEKIITTSTCTNTGLATKEKIEEAKNNK